jgi:hypothetical protein
MVHCAITGIRFPSLAPKPAASLDFSSPVDGEGVEMTGRALPDLPSPPAPGSLSTYSPNDRTDGIAPVSPPPAPVTPVKGGPSMSGESSEQDGPYLAVTPVRGPLSDSSSDGMTLSPEGSTPSTGSKRTSRRYVPMLSPHTTKLEVPVEQAAPPAKPSAMKRVSGQITNWRNSISTMAGPAPIMGKVSEARAAGARKLGALTSVFTSPIATRLRRDQSAGGAGGNDGPQLTDESTTPARAEELGTSIDIPTQEPASGGIAADFGDEPAATVVTDAGDIDGQRHALIDAAEIFAPQLDPILDPEGWLDSYATCVSANYRALHSGIKAILDLYAYVQQSDQHNNSNGELNKLRGEQAEVLEDLCLFESQRAEIMAELLQCSEETERMAVVKEKVDLCNLQVTLHWSMLITALRRVMQQLCPLLREEYRRAARAFWRGQVLIQTKRFVVLACRQPSR